MSRKKESIVRPSFMIPYPDCWESRTRIDLTFNLGDAIRYHREMTVPEIGGLRFVRQASWAVAGIYLASIKYAKRYRAHELANAIEALGSKIHFVIECGCDKSKYSYLGSRAFGNDSTTFSFQNLKKSSYYVQNTYRQTIVTSLRPLNFCKGSSFFDQMELSENGQNLCKAFFGKDKISNCLVENWLEKWIFENKIFNISSQKYADIFSPQKPSKEECDILCRSLELPVTNKQILDFDPQRRYRLIEIMNNQKILKESDLMESLSKDSEMGQIHALQIKDAMNFNEIRFNAISLLETCAHDVKKRNGRNGCPLSDCVASVSEKLTSLRDSCKLYLAELETHNQYNKIPVSIKNFARIFAGYDNSEASACTCLNFLIKQEQGIMDVVDGKIIALSLFDKFIERSSGQGDNEANSEDNDDLSEVVSGTWKLPRLNQWRSLFNDAYRVGSHV